MILVHASLGEIIGVIVLGTALLLIAGAWALHRVQMFIRGKKG